MDFLTQPFQLEFMRLALAEVLLLSVVSGLLGAQIVLRRLAFFTHGVGAAAFPGLVLAGPAGIPAQAAALMTGAAFAGGLDGLRRRARIGADAATALLLVASLAVGIVLASDVFPAGAGVDRLLFGTLVGITPSDLAVTGLAVLLVTATALVAGRAWLTTGFDEQTAPTLGIRVGLAERALVLAVAVAVVATIDAAGALLVGALLVVPAATARLLANRVRGLQLGSLGLAALEGVVGLWIAYQLDTPPGPAIAVLAGLVFAVAAAVAALRGAPG